MSKYILAITLALAVTGCFRTDHPEQKFLSEIYYPELSSRINGLDPDHASENWLNIIDFGDASDYDAGYIEHAVNIELDFFIDTNGYLVNQGKAITQRYDERWPFVIYSSSNDTIAYYAAKTIHGLGYPRVYFYSGGVENWQKENGDYLLINYPSVKEWHADFYPFEDSLNVIIDVHPSAWFSGTSVLEGHIPGAVNIPNDVLIQSSGEGYSLVNDGSALSDLIPDREAKIVVYDSEGNANMAEGFLWAAVELGYNQLFLFRNGYDEWLSRGDSLSLVE